MPKGNPGGYKRYGDPRSGLKKAGAKAHKMPGCVPMPPMGRKPAVAGRSAGKKR
jgi:hypothetical protein